MTTAGNSALLAQRNFLFTMITRLLTGGIGIERVFNAKTSSAPKRAQTFRKRGVIEQNVLCAGAVRHS